ncbi:MAG TPA: hypothetical protein PL107_00075 [Candidatus Marinimicrobia bacterium]|nr:hypothetical protein [Candidatus Neomarinimicrobiota bacterium]
MADNWAIVGQLNEGRDSEFASALLPDGTDRVGAHKTASIPQRSVAGLMHAPTWSVHSKTQNTPK